MSLLTRRRMMGVKESSAILPSEYQQVEWIYTDSGIKSAYINTQYVPHLSDEIYIKIAPLTRSQTCPFSAGTGTHQFVAIIQGNGTSYVRAFDTSADSYVFGYYENDELEFHSYRDGGAFKTLFENITLNTRHTYTNNAIAELDGSATNLYLFRRRNERQSFSGKVFAFWAKDGNGNYLANYVPCYRKSDGEIGMYDTVSKMFFTSANTGRFTKGADV